MTVSALLNSVPPYWIIPACAPRFMTGSRAAIYDGHALYVSPAMLKLIRGAAKDGEEAADRLARAIPVNVVARVGGVLLERVVVEVK